MSSIYITEPPTSGKVLLKTTVGDIDIELWAKETPKACRNFIQLCLENYYNNTMFHRVEKGFIVQGGDPNNDGSGGESIYGAPFKDEFHSRLRFNRRGLVGMANGGPDDNGSQFFFTLSETPELQKKNTLFGKITGDTLFNMLKLEEGLIENGRPHYPHKILKCLVLSNPFADIVPRMPEVQPKPDEPKKKKKREPGVKNLKLLSFGEEAEENEHLPPTELDVAETIETKQKGMVSSHDVLDDPKLSKQTVYDNNEQLKTETNEAKEKKGTVDNSDRQNDASFEMRIEDNEGDDDGEESDDEDEDEDEEKRLQILKLKMMRKKLSEVQKENSQSKVNAENIEEKRKKVREQIEVVKKELKLAKKREEEQAEIARKNKEKKETDSRNEAAEDQNSVTNSLLDTYKKSIVEFKQKKANAYKKTSKNDESQTFSLLKKFKDKILEAKKLKRSDHVSEADSKSELWNHRFVNEEQKDPVLAKDANLKTDDWYEIYDPKNPLNRRRRGETQSTSSDTSTAPVAKKKKKL